MRLLPHLCRPSLRRSRMRTSPAEPDRESLGPLSLAGPTVSGGLAAFAAFVMSLHAGPKFDAVISVRRLPLAVYGVSQKQNRHPKVAAQLR